jgi:hypothetical protein
MDATYLEYNTKSKPKTLQKDTKMPSIQAAGLPCHCWLFLIGSTGDRRLASNQQGKKYFPEVDLAY